MVAMAIGVAGVTLTPSPAHAATAVFVQESKWSSGYVGRMTVTNDGAAAMPNWRVEFDLPAGTTIAHHWNATVTRTGSRYVVTGASWNANLAPGASTSFGWVAAGSGVPQACLLNGAPCDGRPPVRDVQPPSTPANLRGGGQGSTFTLQWEASTDDTGVTGYEIYTNTGSGPDRDSDRDQPQHADATTDGDDLRSAGDRRGRQPLTLRDLRPGHPAGRHPARPAGEPHAQRAERRLLHPPVGRAPGRPVRRRL